MKKKIKKINAAILIIGNEILSGRTQDKNIIFLTNWLNTKCGISVNEARIIPDIEKTIMKNILILSKKFNYVFTTGGIGPTHDDITADAIAHAFKVGLSVREDAKRLLSTNYSDGESSLNEARLKMATVPDGAVLIDNPISKAPGFFLENVYVMAGVPSIFEVMVESLLPSLVGGTPLLSVSVKFLKPESEIAKKLEILAVDFPDGSIGSYPFNFEGNHGTNVVARYRDKEMLKVVEEKLKKMR